MTFNRTNNTIGVFDFECVLFFNKFCTQESLFQCKHYKVNLCTSMAWRRRHAPQPTGTNPTAGISTTTNTPMCRHNGSVTLCVVVHAYCVVLPLSLVFIITLFCVIALYLCCIPALKFVFTITPLQLYFTLSMGFFCEMLRFPNDLQLLPLMLVSHPYPYNLIAHQP